MTTPPIDRMFKAMADVTRRRILHMLAQGELCVCDLMAALRLPQSKVSRHLAYLRAAELVRDRKDGLWKHYTLARPGTRFQKGLIACLTNCFDEAAVLRRDRAALRKRRQEVRLICRKRK